MCVHVHSCVKIVGPGVSVIEMEEKAEYDSMVSISFNNRKSRTSGSPDHVTNTTVLASLFMLHHNQFSSVVFEHTKLQSTADFCGEQQLFLWFPTMDTTAV